jgi:predicted deacylase
MLKETLVHLASPSRDDFRVEGFRFLPSDGKQPKVRIAIVAGLSGRELAQMHAAAQLINFLKEHQAEDPEFIDAEILIVPAVNTFGFNMGERHWPLDKTDINAMFPGFAKGETTQRIAHHLFEAVKGFDYGIELIDRRDQYDCMPYVQIINSGFECKETAKSFGLQFAHMPHFKPADAGSLQYNWAVFETKAYGLVFGNSQSIDQPTINTVLDALIRFLSQTGAIKAFGGLQLGPTR